MSNDRAPGLLIVLVGIDLCIGVGLVAAGLVQMVVRPPPTETVVLGRLAPVTYFVGRLAPGLLPIVLGVAFYRRERSFRGVGLACGWIAIFFGLLFTGGLIALLVLGADLNRVDDGKSSSLALIDIGIAEFWWAVGWACLAFFTGVMHLWVLTRDIVRDYFPSRPA